MKIKKLVLSGLQGSGKTTTANLVRRWAEDQGWTAINLKFADPLYEMHEAVRSVALEYKLPMAKKDGKLLQLLGTEWGRQTFGEDVWVNATKEAVARMVGYWETKGIKNGLVIIDDCRFPNEFHNFFDALRVRLVADRGIRMARTESWRNNEEHPSETALNGFEDRFDLVLDTGKQSAKEVAELIVKRLSE